MNTTTKKLFSRIGFAAVLMFVATVIGQVFALLITNLLSPELAKTNLVTWIPVAIGFYLCGTPVCYFMLKKLPSFPKRNEVRMPAQKIFLLFVLVMASAYLFNFVSVFINFGIALLKGAPVMNPLSSTMGMDPLSLVFSFVFGCILSPLVEELIFRKFFLERIRPYGEKTAIWVTAILFGLYHMNLSQLLYAVALGLIFAYAAVKTNSIKTSFLLHMLANSFGLLIVPALTGAFNGTPFILGSMIAVVFIFSMIIAGFFIFFRNRKKTVLEEGLKEQDTSITKTAIYINPGMIVYYILVLVNIIGVILMPMAV